MSLAMYKPLPPLQTTDENSSQNRCLPPLSQLLSAIAPKSPPMEATDLKQHQITTRSSLTTLPAMQTPVRLPSFDSLKLAAPEEGSKSISFQRSLSQPSMSQWSSPLPTPRSQMHQQTAQLSSVPQESPLVQKRSYAFISHSPSTFPNQEPSIDNAQLARRKRRRTTPKESAILHEEFEKGSTPNRARRTEIAAKVNMTEKAVQIWFQNRRQTLRRQSQAEKEVHHLEPIYPSFPNTAGGADTSRREQSNLKTQTFTPFQTHADSGIVAPLSPRQFPLGSSPIKQMFQTPLRTVNKTAVNGETLTFKLTKSPISNPSNTTIMTPISSRNRQRPIMKVNPSPPRSSQIETFENKENMDLKCKSEDTENKEIRVTERVPLGELKRTN